MTDEERQAQLAKDLQALLEADVIAFDDCPNCCGTGFYTVITDAGEDKVIHCMRCSGMGTSVVIREP